jgi:hypothetical protein
MKDKSHFDSQHKQDVFLSLNHPDWLWGLSMETWITYPKDKLDLHPQAVLSIRMSHATPPLPHTLHGVAQGLTNACAVSE